MSGLATPEGGGRSSWSPTFLRSKKKKRRQRQKRNGFKAETIKRLSPRSKDYFFSHTRSSTIRKFFLLANHGGRQYFSVLHGPPTLKSILRPCMCVSSLWVHNFVLNLFERLHQEPDVVAAEG